MPLLIFSQNSVSNDTNSYNKYRLPSVSIGPSFQSFYGDLGESNSSFRFNTKFRPGVALSLEQRLTPTFGVGLTGVYGKLSDSERRKDGRHINFESDLMSADLKLYLHLDNGKIMGQRTRFSFNFFGGIGFMSFNPYGDLKDKNNNPYFYWNDGTIRDAAFDIDNPQNGNIVERDFKYETKLDSLSLYPKTAMYVPVGGTINYKLSDRFETNIMFVYNITGTDYIDNYGSKSSFGSKINDKYFQCMITLQYNIGGKSGMNKYYNKVNFGQLDKTDSDGDKVADISDECPETPSGVKVDKKGCPEDTDKDGVADYIDKEPNTRDSVRVDEFGVTMTDSMYLAIQLKDSLLTLGEWDLYESRLADQKRNDSLALVAINNPNTNTTTPVDSNSNVADGGSEVTKGNNDNTNSTVENSSVENGSDTKTGKVDPAYNAITNDTSSVVAVKDPVIKEITSAQKGVIFRIQIASSAAKVPASYFKTKYRVTEEVFVTQQSGTYKYAIGNFKSYEEAKAFNEKFKQKYSFGSFITPYKDGTRITLQEALAK